MVTGAFITNWIQSTLGPCIFKYSIILFVTYSGNRSPSWNLKTCWTCHRVAASWWMGGGAMCSSTDSQSIGANLRVSMMHCIADFSWLSTSQVWLFLVHIGVQYSAAGYARKLHMYHENCAMQQEAAPSTTLRIGYRRVTKWALMIIYIYQLASEQRAPELERPALPNWGT